jgi:hypothetical protein
MKVRYGYRPKQNGIPIKHKGYCLNLNEKKIVKGDNITKNYGAMDLRKPFFGWGINLFTIFIYRFRHWYM